ncbi:MAG: CoA-binding protein [Acidobacteriota bacterium]
MPSILIVGASAKRHNFGNKCVRAYQEAGYEVFPVNPRAGEIEGAPVFAEIAAAPPADRAALYLPPERLAPLLPELAKREFPEGVYFNPGTWTPQLLDEARALGIAVRQACAIVALGRSPSEFP